MRCETRKTRNVYDSVRAECPDRVTPQAESRLGEPGAGARTERGWPLARHGGAQRVWELDGGGGRTTPPAARSEVANLAPCERRLELLKDIARTKSPRFLSLPEKSEDRATLGSRSWGAAVSRRGRRPGHVALLPATPPRSLSPSESAEFFPPCSKEDGDPRGTDASARSGQRTDKPRGPQA